MRFSIRLFILAISFNLVACAASQNTEPTIKALGTAKNIETNLGIPEEKHTFTKEEMDQYYLLSTLISPPAAMFPENQYEVWIYPSPNDQHLICVITTQGIVVDQFITKGNQSLQTIPAKNTTINTWDAIGIALDVGHFALETTNTVLKILSKF